MNKKIKCFLLSLFSFLTMISCNKETYSFINVTGHNINEIKSVLYNEEPMQSLQSNFEGDYSRFLNVNYLKVEDNKALNEYINAKDNYEFCFFVEYNNKEEISNFYVHNNRIYTLGKDENLYKSKSNVSLNEIKNEAKYIEPYSENVSTALTKNARFMAKYDYGFHRENKATILLDGIIPFFNPKNYGVNELVAGDVVEMEYYGEFLILEEYPASINLSAAEIVSINIEEADIYEFEILAVPGSGDLDIVPLDHNMYSYRFETENVINKDGSYQNYRKLGYGKKIYGSIPKSRSSFTIMALYSYNPKANSNECNTYLKAYKEPTCLEEGYTIFGCDCHEKDVYQKIEKVSCSFDENNVCIWCNNIRPISHVIRISNSDIIDNKKIVINTKEEFDSLIIDSDINLYNSDANLILDLYDEEYFINHSLIAINKVEGSGSISFDVTRVKEESNSIVIDIQKNVPIMGSCDMAYWLILIEIDKKIISDYEININYIENEIDNYS